MNSVFTFEILQIMISHIVHLLSTVYTIASDLSKFE